MADLTRTAARSSIAQAGTVAAALAVVANVAVALAVTALLDVPADHRPPRSSSGC